LTRRRRDNCQSIALSESVFQYSSAPQ
jgi:hypothetical protein